MKLVIDNRDNLQGRPGLHALIVGVSAYSNLPKQNEPQKEPLKSETFGMRQLSSAALTAYKVYCWLLEHQRNLPVPLATCRLLLSPSRDEVAAAPELNGLADPCILNNFLLAANDWRKDAGSDHGNMTFFYFAGHGVQRTRDDAVLLLEDFGDGIGGFLKNAVDINNIFKGMAKSQAYPKMAQTQLYIVDACRDFVSEFKNYEKENTTQVFRGLELTGGDDRMAPIFFAAAPGTQAHSFRNQTLFSKYLLDCLNGEAGKLEEEQDLWSVSVYSLSKGLTAKINDWNKTSEYKQDFVPSGFMKEFDILFLDQAPLVKVVLNVEPLDALKYTRINVLDNRLVALSEPIPFPIPQKIHPYQCKWTAGTYTISAEIETEDPRFVKFPPKSIQVVPPRFIRKIKVTK